MELINDLKKEVDIFNRYRKKYKLFGGFVFIFVFMFIIKLILNISLNYSNETLDMFYNVLLGSSMSALFYYWIEYKRKYVIIEKNKEKILEELKKIDKMLEEVYYNKRHYEIKWGYYLEIFDYLEKIIKITYKYDWFETSYVESLMWIQIQDNYKYLRNKKNKIEEIKKEGERLSIKEDSDDLDKKMSQSIKFEEIKKDIIKNGKLKKRLRVSDEMQKRIEKVTGDKVQIGGGYNFYYRYYEEEILIIKCLFVITDEVREVVRKLKI
ncbi:MAG: hypothetical protein WBG30_02890 [Psychrilyobacter sp.]|uniref:hypothetical protein n=1 Tax=Psychrilyobacter sp. TaxID=2586924 RepID=UPI003C770642